MIGFNFKKIFKLKLNNKNDWIHRKFTVLKLNSSLLVSRNQTSKKS